MWYRLKKDGCPTLLYSSELPYLNSCRYALPRLACHSLSTPAQFSRHEQCLLAQADCQLKNAVDLIVDCAFGTAPYKDTSQIPAQSTCVDVAVRESAYNPLHPQNQLQQQDETLYVAFQQHIQIKVTSSRLPRHAVSCGPVCCSCTTSDVGGYYCRVKLSASCLMQSTNPISCIMMDSCHMIQNHIGSTTHQEST